MRVDSVKVEMLGGFSVWVNGKTVVNNAAKLTKPWQLFCYFVLHREKFISGRRLIATLWADDVLADPANVLKNVVYSLRKELCGGDNVNDRSIVYSAGAYRFDPTVHLELDVDYFDELCARALNSAEKSEARMDLCRQATAAYKGDFLPQLDQYLWVVPLTLYYRRRYMDCVHNLCEYLWRQNLHKELLELTLTAVKHDALDEQANIYLFRTMDALKMSRVIVTTYSKVARHHEEVLGSEPPCEVQTIYKAAGEHINKTEQDIIVIKTELAYDMQPARPQHGAYYCGYSNLRHIFDLNKRAAERNGQMMVLVLFTLMPAKTTNPAQYDLVRAMAEFKVVAMGILHKADVLSRYSRNQYVMLLSVSSLDEARLVREHIREGFGATTLGRQIALDVKLTGV